MKASDKVGIVPGHPLQTLQNCGGYYECPKDDDGKRLGPLVAYAGKYGDPPRNYVGDVYLNCARAERFPHVLRHFSREISQECWETFDDIDWIMGVPSGGQSFGLMLARELDCEFVYPDVEKVSGNNGRKETVMRIGRHPLEPGTRGIIVEDVCHNFSSSGKAIKLAESQEAEVVGVACIFNRSGRDLFFENGLHLPLVALHNVTANQYRQDDPFVASDVLAGNVEFEVKKNWPELEKAMAEHGHAGAFSTGAGP